MYVLSLNEFLLLCPSVLHFADFGQVLSEPPILTIKFWKFWSDKGQNFFRPIFQINYRFQISEENMGNSQSGFAVNRGACRLELGIFYGLWAIGVIFLPPRKLVSSLLFA